MRLRRSAHKLNRNHQTVPKFRKQQDTDLEDTKPLKTIGGTEGENTCLRNDLAKSNTKSSSDEPRMHPATHLAPPEGGSKPTKLVLKDGGTHFEGDEPCLRMTFGTSDGDLVSKLFLQVVAAAPNGQPAGAGDYNHVLAALHGIGPHDPLEGMLAAQMVAVHHQAMACMEKMVTKGLPDISVDLNLNRATKLLRTFTAQMEALNRHRDKGANKMIVEQVHVHDRGQAIVGPVSHHSSGVVVKEDDDGKSNR